MHRRKKQDGSMSLYTELLFPNFFFARSLKFLTIIEFFMVDQPSSEIEDCAEPSELFSLSFAFGCSLTD